MRLVLDITNSSRVSRATGIERVARDLAHAAAQNLDNVLFVAFRDSGSRLHHLMSTEVDQLSLSEHALQEYEPQAGDIMVFLDLIHIELVAAKSSGLLASYRSAGVALWSVVYDLLPLELPQYFLSHLPESHEKWLGVVAELDGALCISNSTAKALRRWWSKSNSSFGSQSAVKVFSLASSLADRVSLQARSAVSDTKGNTGEVRFLMIGTLEPRKGHVQAIGAVKKLRKKGINARLVLVGAWGWKFRKIQRQLHRAKSFVDLVASPEDDVVEEIIASSTALLAASEGEGFGLPIIEAAAREIPIIARDIEVFREVAGAGAFYFNSKRPRVLAKRLEEWLDLYFLDLHPKPTGITVTSVTDSLQSLVSALSEKADAGPN